MNSPTYTALDLAPFPKADGEALHYIERVEQGVIPGPCSQARTRRGD